MKIIKIPIADVDTFHDARFVEIIRDSYWLVSSDGCIYKAKSEMGSFQCNTDKNIMDQRRPILPGDTVVFFTALYFTVDPIEWEYPQLDEYEVIDKKFT